MKELEIADKAKVINKIGNFIDHTKHERGVDGVVILFSGYIDSTVIAKISLDVLGQENVKLLVRSENVYDKHTEVISNSTSYLEIPEDNIIHCDVAPIIKSFTNDDLIPGRSREIPSLYQPLSYSLLKSSLIKEIEGSTYGMVGKANSGRERLINKIIAHNKLRSRIQMAIAYLTAETENAFLLGTINKTELLTGLFTKWGHGHCADIMPLGNLYRSQILQIAEYLEIPPEISNLAKADLLPGIRNKYEYFFNLDSKSVDRILIRLENGLAIEEISNETEIDIKPIEKINHYFTSAGYTRGAPLIPKV